MTYGTAVLLGLVLSLLVARRLSARRAALGVVESVLPEERAPLRLVAIIGAALGALAAAGAMMYT